MTLTTRLAHIGGVLTLALGSLLLAPIIAIWWRDLLA